MRVFLLDCSLLFLSISTSCTGDERLDPAKLLGMRDCVVSAELPWQTHKGGVEQGLPAFGPAQ
jgi:hypothetical protein